MLQDYETWQRPMKARLCGLHSIVQDAAVHHHLGENSVGEVTTIFVAVETQGPDDARTKLAVTSQ